MAQVPYGTLGPVSYAHITNAGTVLVKNAPGALLTTNINGLTVNSTATLYDVNNTATLGTVEVGILTLGSTPPTPLKTNFGPEGAGLALKNGLVVVTTGTVDLTIGYR